MPPVGEGEGRAAPVEGHLGCQVLGVSLGDLFLYALAALCIARFVWLGGE